MIRPLHLDTQKRPRPFRDGSVAMYPIACALAVPPWLLRLKRSRSVDGGSQTNGCDDRAGVTGATPVRLSAKACCLRPGSADSSGGIFRAAFAVRLAPSRTRLDEALRLLVSIDAFVYNLTISLCHGVGGVSS